MSDDIKVDEIKSEEVVTDETKTSDFIDEMEFSYSSLTWCGTKKETLHVTDLVVAGVKYGNCLLSITDNPIGRKLVEYIIENNIEPAVEETGNYEVEMTDEQLFTYIQNTVSQIMDDKAREKNYDDAVACCSYAGDPDETFNREGTAFKSWRSKVWRTCYSLLGEYTSGKIKRPTLNDVLLALPTFDWKDIEPTETTESVETTTTANES